MKYQDNYRPTRKDLQRLQEYVASQPIKGIPQEINDFIEKKRDTEKQQRDLSLLIG